MPLCEGRGSKLVMKQHHQRDEEYKERASEELIKKQTNSLESSDRICILQLK